MKPRPDDILANLNQDDQEQLTDWLLSRSYREVQEQLAKPRPDGFNLKVGITTLSRFYARFCQPHLAEHRNLMLDLDRSLKIAVPEGTQPLAQSALTALQERLFRICLSPSA